MPEETREKELSLAERDMGLDGRWIRNYLMLGGQPGEGPELEPELERECARASKRGKSSRRSPMGNYEQGTMVVILPCGRESKFLGGREKDCPGLLQYGGLQ